MGSLQTSAAILAGLPAGFVALLAPCCFAVLLAAYFTRATHERGRLVAMTTVFASGIYLVYLIPAVSTAALAQSFLAYHMWVFKAGGALMLVLGVMLLLGKRTMLPKPAWLAAKSRDGMRAQDSYGFGSVFSLGVVSGASTLCCAPVLAGVLSLSSAKGSIPVALAAELYFVLGMTLPLFLIAVAADRETIRRHLRDMQKRPVVSYRLCARQVSLTSGDLLAAVLYVVFGLAMLVFVDGGMGEAGARELAMNMQTIRITAWLEVNASMMPLWLTVAFPFILVAALFAAVARKSGKEIRDAEEAPARQDGAEAGTPALGSDTRDGTAGARRGSCCHE